MRVFSLLPCVTMLVLGSGCASVSKMSHTAAVPNQKTGGTVALEPLSPVTPWLPVHGTTPDGKAVLVTQHNSVGLLNVKTKQVLHSISLPSSPSGVLLSPQGSSVAVVYENKREIEIWNLAEKRVEKQLLGATNNTVLRAFSPDGRTLVTSTGYSSPFLQIWDVEAGTERVRVELKDQFLRTVSFSPKGDRFLTVCNEGPLLIWDTLSGHQIDSWPVLPLGSHKAVVMAHQIGSGPVAPSYRTAVYDPSGNMLAVATADGTISIYDARSRRVLQRFPRPNQLFWSLVFSPDGSQLLASSREPALEAWNVRTGQSLYKTALSPLFFYERYQTTYSQDGQYLVALPQSNTATTQVFDAATGRPMHAFSFELPSWKEVSLSPDGNVLALTTKSHAVFLYNLRTQSWIHTEMEEAWEPLVDAKWEATQRLRLIADRYSWKWKTDTLFSRAVQEEHALPYAPYGTVHGNTNAACFGVVLGKHMRVWNWQQKKDIDIPSDLSLYGTTVSNDCMWAAASVYPPPANRKKDAAFLIMDLAQRKTLRQFRIAEPWKGPLVLTLAAEGRVVYAADAREGTIWMFRTADGALMKRIKGKFPVQALWVKEDRIWIENEKETIVYDLVSKRKIRIRDPWGSLHFVRDDTQRNSVILYNDSVVRVVDTNTWQVVANIVSPQHEGRTIPPLVVQGLPKKR